MSDPVRIEGIEEALRRLAPEQVAAASRQLLQRIALVVERASRRRTPVRTGNLRRSLASEVQGAERAIVGTNVRYARSVHARKPFLRWGLEDARADIADAVRRVGADLVEGR